ncbi:dehydrogenase [Marinilongibacter aquaticus]|uniref:PVC-type heme-binding CxxCH protein n=1 Tax=Marinilongibacter aquaticus TaxID=2975157 RepID=UPI0021BD40D6|nr:PVC-type heme-binding CxxCH protein [Marinilongibacter aquaticus]UBM58299.1 dehydrogenase [Marinilongibacter aquaticus]
MKGLFTLCLSLLVGFALFAQEPEIDREFTLEASMLGYFAPDGTRNPTLKIKKGDWVRIHVVDTEQMTHDIALEKAEVKSKPVNQKGERTSITFQALKNDTYYCTVPGHRTAGMVGEIEVSETEEIVRQIIAFPAVKNGKVLNLGFENGDLSDWTIAGEAFVGGLIKSEPSPLHDKEARIGQSGNYFISSGGTEKYKKLGTLQSVPFPITHNYASFLVSGGALEDTRVEIVLAENEEVVFYSTGQGRATLQPVVVDLSKFRGKEVFIRLVDNETGISQIPYIKDEKFAHINFDNFLFYDNRPEFPNELLKKDIIVLPPMDPVLNAGLSGEEAAKAMTLPEGFKIQLAASEPEIIRPICFTVDWKGRLWVVEGMTYPVRAAEGEGKDRILIFEDTDGDGTLDSRKVFYEGLNLVSGMEIGMGGVWIGAAPYFMFIPADFENDRPSGPPQILLDGWGLHDTHETLNSLRWGPDGWLYGNHGVFTHSNVGKPGTPDSLRTKLNAGVWRYHPTKKTFEVFAEGTSNPWGLDYNQYGHIFVTACVIPHLYHMIQGGRFVRQAGQHFEPYTYNDISTIADHVHWLGDRGPHAGNFRSAAAGGGHAHAGAMIYLGGHNWPKEYFNTLFMNNINGARFNNDRPLREGSGYVGKHSKDFIVMNDSWSQWLNFKYDQNGSVYVIDWYDKNQCHSPNPDVHDKSLGRIFKITYKGDGWKKEDLAKKSNVELAQYQTHENDWYARWSRTLLQERGGDTASQQLLWEILKKNQDERFRLRALWTLHALGALEEGELLKLLDDKNEYVRSWAIQFLAEDKQFSTKVLNKFENLSKNDPSAVVRLYLASVVQRMDKSQTWNILDNLSQKEEDAEDHNLPLLVWYGLEPMAEVNAKRFLQITQDSPLPSFSAYGIRRVAELGSLEAKALLLDLKGKMGHEQHVEMGLIENALKEKFND